MQERRHYVRVTSPALIEFPSPTLGRTERSFTYDLSETGLRFPTSVELHVGDELPVTIHLPVRNLTMLAKSEVTWIREIARLGMTHYDVGIQFREMAKTDRRKLSQHLAALLGARV